MAESEVAKSKLGAPPLALILVLALALVSLGSFRSLDVFWHVATGDWIRAHGQVMIHDPFSYTAHGVSWIAHSWGGALVMSFMHSMGGFAALGFFKAAMMSLSLWLLLALFAEGGHRGGLFRLCALLLGVIFLARQSLIRPKLFTIFFFACQEYWLCRFRGKPRTYFALVPLYLLWANLHGGVIVGLAFLALHGLGSLLERRREASWIFGTFASSVVVCLFNPQGGLLLVYPFQYLDGAAFPRFILEWQALTPASSPLSWLALLVIAGVLVWARRREGKTGRMSWEELLLGAGALYLALRFRRNEYLLAFTLLPMALRRLSPLKGSFGGRFPLAPREGRWFGILFLILVCAAGTLGQLRSARDWERSHPALAPDLVDLLVQEGEGRKGPLRLLNEFEQGGYLIWRSWPKFRVAIDGRNDFYHREGVFGAYLGALSSGKGLEDFLQRYPCDIAMTRSDSALDALLRSDARGWVKGPFTKKGTIWFRRPVAKFSDPIIR